MKTRGGKMKKLVILSQEQINFVEEYSKSVSTKGCSNFSKGLRRIIDEFKRQSVQTTRTDNKSPGTAVQMEQSP